MNIIFASLNHENHLFVPRGTYLLLSQTTTDDNVTLTFYQFFPLKNELSRQKIPGHHIIRAGSHHRRDTLHPFIDEPFFKEPAQETSTAFKHEVHNTVAGVEFIEKRAEIPHLFPGECALMVLIGEQLGHRWQ